MIGQLGAEQGRLHVAWQVGDFDGVVSDLRELVVSVLGHIVDLSVHVDSVQEENHHDDEVSDDHDVGQCSSVHFAERSIHHKVVAVVLELQTRLFQDFIGQSRVFSLHFRLAFIDNDFVDGELRFTRQFAVASVVELLLEFFGDASHRADCIIEISWLVLVRNSVVNKFVVLDAGDGTSVAVEIQVVGLESLVDGVGVTFIVANVAQRQGHDN